MKKFLLIGGGVIAAAIVILLLIPLPENQTREYLAAQNRQAMREKFVSTGYTFPENLMCSARRLSPASRETLIRLHIDKQGGVSSRETRAASADSFNALEACGASLGELATDDGTIQIGLALASLKVSDGG
ncbi:hypothetical protein [Brevundimonas nasdae]|uniref:hypothetical protein n=1 Tax=Brevundimonas nasdae TaxID=172043 RepID=UPI0012EE55E1|nr:hypothetical protein [Brevundimonas nasdae]